MASPIIAIVGPTASGKSSLADTLALHFNTHVISVDALQIYKDMNIGVAKLPPEERKAKLDMVDCAELEETYSVQRFQQEARTCVESLRIHHKQVILCGGTGLYLNAVIDDMHFPQGSFENPQRHYYESLVEVEGSDFVFKLLCKRDPASAALIHPHNVRRVIRALEMLDDGISYAEHVKGLQRLKPFYTARIYGLSWPREELYSRIEKRVEAMIEQGLVDEVVRLKARGLQQSKTASQAIGYQEILSYLDGTYSLEMAVDLIKRRTRHYAKRQISWFSRDPRVEWLDCTTQSLDGMCHKIINDIS